MLSRPDHPWWGDVIDRDPALADRIMGEIRERGPLGSRHFEGGPNVGGMWNLKPAKRMLEALWSAGRLVDRRAGRLPADVRPARAGDPRRGARRAGAGRGRGDAARSSSGPSRPAARSPTSGVVEHWRLRGGVAAVRPYTDALVAEGALRREDVDDGGPPVLLAGRAPSVDAAKPAGSVLLSPFDNLLWDRPFAERVLGFRHLIEVYKPAPERRYGYYVLPLVVGDRVAGRADVKADRKAGVLRLLAWHPESRRRSAARDEALERAFARLARQLALEPAAN